LLSLSLATLALTRARARAASRAPTIKGALSLT
jgi:hypothetical protein